MIIVSMIQQLCVALHRRNVSSAATLWRLQVSRFACLAYCLYLFVYEILMSLWLKVEINTCPLWRVNLYNIILVFMLLLCFSFYFTFWLCNKNQVLEYNGWLYAPRINLLNIYVYWYVFKIRTGFVCKSNGVLIFFLKNFKKSKKMPLL